MGHRVRVVHDEGGRLVAVKSPPPDDPDRTRREAAILHGLRHPGVVEVVDAPTGDDVVCTRWVGSRTLGDLPRPLEPARAAGMVLAVTATVADLHGAGVVHGNLDATHVLLDAHGRPVLCGFGDARRLDGDDPPRPSTDVAALGALLAAVLTPPDATTDAARDDPPRRRLRRRESGAQRALLAVAEHATAADPADRPGLRAFADAVRHAAPDATLTTATVGTGDDRGPGSAERRRAGDDPLVVLLADPVIGPTTAGRPDPGRTDPLRVDDPDRTGERSGFWDELEQLRRSDDPDRVHRRRQWWGAGATAIALAVLGFVGMSATTGDPTPQTGAAAASTTTASVPRPERARTSTPTTTTTGPPITVTAARPPVTIDHGGRRFAVGAPGDIVVVGEWRCDGQEVPAALRPSTGSVFVFDAWPAAGEHHDVAPTAAVPGGTALAPGATGPDGCPTLVVERGTAAPVVLGPGDLR